MLDYSPVNIMKTINWIFNISRLCYKTDFITSYLVYSISWDSKIELKKPCIFCESFMNRIIPMHES